MAKTPFEDSDLSEQQNRFCEEYLKDLNASKAAMRAGYSEHTSAEQGSRLLTIVKVQMKVQELMEARSKRTKIGADRILKELFHIATVDISAAYDDNGHLLPVKKIPRAIRRAIAAIKVFDEFEGFGRDRVKVGEVREVKFNDKIRALELLGKHLKLFTDKVEHSGADGAPMVLITLPDNGRDQKKDDEEK